MAKKGGKRSSRAAEHPACPERRIPADQKPLGKWGYTARPRAGVESK